MQNTALPYEIKIGISYLANYQSKRCPEMAENFLWRKETLP